MTLWVLNWDIFHIRNWPTVFQCLRKILITYILHLQYFLSYSFIYSWVTAVICSYNLFYLLCCTACIRGAIIPAVMWLGGLISLWVDLSSGRHTFASWSMSCLVAWMLFCIPPLCKMLNCDKISYWLTVKSKKKPKTFFGICTTWVYFISF